MYLISKKLYRSIYFSLNLINFFFFFFFDYNHKILTLPLAICTLPHLGCSVIQYNLNPLTFANGKFRRGLCIRNLVVTDISVCETPILQTGISLIKNVYQSEVFFDLRVSISSKLLVSEISPGNVIIILTYQVLMILKMASKKTPPGWKQVLEYKPSVKG